MSRYLNAALYGLRFNSLWNVAAAACVLLLTPVLFGITALDYASAAVPFEMSLPFIGVILLTPVYAPEQEPGVLDAVRARKMPYILICFIRVIMAFIFTAIFIFGFVLLMSALESDVTFTLAAASCANAVFLGGLGILASSVSGSAVIGYMITILFYVVDLMGGLGSFTIFSMTRNGNMNGKPAIFAAGMFCAAVSLIYRHFRINKQG